MGDVESNTSSIGNADDLSKHIEEENQQGLSTTEAVEVLTVAGLASEKCTVDHNLPQVSWPRCLTLSTSFIMSMRSTAMGSMWPTTFLLCRVGSRSGVHFFLTSCSSTTKNCLGERKSGSMHQTVLFYSSLQRLVTSSPCPSMLDCYGKRQGWEARVDSQSGDTYYVDHNRRVTTWIREYWQTKRILLHLIDVIAGVTRHP